MIFVLMKNKVSSHLIFWILYFIYQVNSEYAYLSTYLPQHLRTDWLDVLNFSVISILVFDLSIVPCFYCLLAIIDSEKAFFRSVVVKVVAVILCIAFFVITFRVSCHYFVYEVIYRVKEDVDSFSLFGIFNALMNIGFGASLALGFEKFRQHLVMKNELSELKSEKLQTELKFLKAQINPHFLFNTLNNIYGLAIKKSDETPDIILKLSKIMRYNIFESAKDTVPIEKDIENIQDFISIQKIRHKELNLQFIHEVDQPFKEISPLILLQFVENAFKYGASESISDAFITIKLQLKDNLLHYEVSNSTDERNRTDSTKIGLQNINRQLELLYPKKYNLETKKENNIYSVSLKIDFNK
ncbi:MULTISPECIES: sensor histidine kinase [unclassified Flavobacterium]|uniref:sensor histidine kinase n=1 Tax=unclassified Flavobacterium TaxID=196869 RepID=UPI0036083EEF